MITEVIYPTDPSLIRDIVLKGFWLPICSFWNEIPLHSGSFNSFTLYVSFDFTFTLASSLQTHRAIRVPFSVRLRRPADLQAVLSLVFVGCEVGLL